MAVTLDALSDAASALVAEHRLDADDNGTIDGRDVSQIDAALARDLPLESKRVLRALRNLGLGAGEGGAVDHGVALREPLALPPRMVVRACPAPHKDGQLDEACVGLARNFYRERVVGHEANQYFIVDMGGGNFLWTEDLKRLHRKWPAEKVTAFKQHLAAARAAGLAAYRDKPGSVVGGGHRDFDGVTVIEQMLYARLHVVAITVSEPAAYSRLLYVYLADGTFLAAGRMDHSTRTMTWFERGSKEDRVRVTLTPEEAARAREVDAEQSRKVAEGAEVATTPAKSAQERVSGSQVRHPHLVKAELVDAKQLIGFGRVAEAKQVLLNAVQEPDPANPDTAEAALRLAEVHLALHENREAVSRVAMFLRLFPKSSHGAAAHLVRAEALVALGQHDAAARDYTAALAQLVGSDDRELLTRAEAGLRLTSPTPPDPEDAPG